ncbi:MAG TPA: GNAT family N-acetyltransferase [Armatimonadota bacterium]|nr:GNAT family N-acetyltransferase [Armatimonadota bacterium]
MGEQEPETMPIEYRDTKDFEAGQLGELFLSVQWLSGKYPDKLKVAMQNSDTVFSAWDGDKLVGLMNAMSDGIMTVYFHFLLVRPEYQGQGIGRTLIRMMLDRYADYLRKILIADDAEIAFYEHCGFEVAKGTTALFITSVALG